MVAEWEQGGKPPCLEIQREGSRPCVHVFTCKLFHMSLSHRSTSRLTTGQRTALNDVEEAHKEVGQRQLHSAF